MPRTAGIPGSTPWRQYGKLGISLLEGLVLAFRDWRCRRAVVILGSSGEGGA